MPERRRLSAHEIFRDIVSVSSLIAIITSAILIGKWLGKNDERWSGQNDLNIKQNITNIHIENELDKIKWHFADGGR
jgi:Na+/citrate or Na+/malate symporter